MIGQQTDRPSGDAVYRVLVPGGHHDVVVTIGDGATVAEVARAIDARTRDAGTGAGGDAANEVGAFADGGAGTSSGGGPGAGTDGAPETELTLELVGDVAVVSDPGQIATDAAPPSGSTVRVVRSSGATTLPPRWSPVTLHRLGADEPDGWAEARLAYGTTTVGAAHLHVGTTVSLHATGSTDRLEVDGSPVRGSSQARAGSILRIGGSTYSLHVEGPLRPPAASGPWRTHRAAVAVREDPEPDPVELPTPPGADRTPGFPVLSATVPLLMGAAMWVATRSLAVAGFVLFSVAFVVASGIEVRREHRRDRLFREQEFLRNLDAAADLARSRHRAELRRAERELPSGEEVTGWALGDHRRLWERRPGLAGALRVRIGTESTTPLDPVVVPKGGRDDLRDRLAEVADEAGEIARPAHVDLATSGLGLVGDGDGPSAVARSVVWQLVGLLGPGDLEIELDTSPERAQAWEWLQWLPHRVHRTRSSRARSDQPLSDRTGAPSRRTAGTHVIRVVDRAGDAAPEDLRGCIWIATDESEVPRGIGTVVGAGARSGAGGGWVRRDDGPRTSMAADHLPLDRCQPAARALTPLRSAGTGGASSLPTTVGLGEVVADPTALLPDGADRVGESWARSRSRPELLTAPIGRGPGGVLHVDLRADGPHGLVAGTTGAGKSELLRTFVTSLALHHPPDRLTFLLVDYKGGAAFGPVAGLPHVVGLVTDLGPSTAHRALASLRAEVRRRERIVATAGAADMADVAGCDAAPALVVVVDEFATLAREVPDLLDGLLDVAQRGRSLGIHLLLATQRPSGVVNDAVRANLSWRLALRVADEDDSRDVVDVADAAHIPAELPGRAVLRLGPRRSVAVQVASTAGPVGSTASVSCRDLGAVDAAEEPSDGALGTEIDAAVANCRAAAIRSGLAQPRRPWVDPLPDRIDLDVLHERTDCRRAGAIVIGEADLPDEQRRGPAVVDLTAGGGVLVLGPPRSGRTTALHAIGAAAVADDSAPTTVYALDSVRSLAGLADVVDQAGSVGDVIGVDDVERTLRLLRSLHTRVQTNRSATSGPTSDPTGRPGDRVVVLVDGIGAFVDRHESVNRGEATDLLASIALDGPGAGVHLVVSANRTAEVPAAILASLDHLLVLRSSTPHEVVADPGLPPGRGFLDGVVVQVGVPAPAPSSPSGGGHHGTAGGASDRRRAVGRLPVDVDGRTLPPVEGWRVPVGVRHDDLAPAVLDLADHGAIVLGPPRSGRTTALRTIADNAVRTDPAARILWIDRDTPTADAVAVLDQVVAGLGEPQSPYTFVLVDDLPELLDRPDGTAIDDLVDEVLRDRSAPVRIVASGDADGAARCYAASLRRLRSGRTGVLLRPDVDLHPGLLHTVLPLHDELASAPGRGWIVTPDEVVAVQLAH